MLQSELCNGCAQLETDLNQGPNFRSSLPARGRVKLIFGLCDQVSILSTQLMLEDWDIAKKPMT